MQFDLPLDELRRYRPPVEEPDNFEDYWARTLDVEARRPLDVEARPAESVISALEVFDVSFGGHGGARVAGWLLVPRDAAAMAPVVVEFVGYGGGRGRPTEWLNWACAGFPHLVMDSRGQGGGWRGADTPDVGATGEPGARGFLTSGLSAPQSHYYTRLFVDATRALSVPAEIPALIGRPLISTGVSQGGGVALAAAHLHGGVAAIATDVPFLCNFRRATAVTDSAPYAEISDYCRLYPERVDQVFTTLSYFDAVNHARRLQVPALFSVGLADLVTPPSTVFSAYNHYPGEKAIEVYPFNGHDGAASVHFERKVAFARGLAE
ncbi:MAG: acetylxylan esterase [Ilumatobacteraceae bacterium]